MVRREASGLESERRMARQLALPLRPANNWKLPSKLETAWILDWITLGVCLITASTFPHALRSLAHGSASGRLAGLTSLAVMAARLANTAVECRAGAL